jgi:glycosyltransferase involved in cell wall biosynthesis
MSSSPLVSVIVPVYNVEPYLAAALDSICAQTYRNLEILLIDDCSTDASPEICADYAQRDSRIRVLRNAVNCGQAVARNVGLDAAQGEYVAFVDSDDLISPDYIEVLLRGVMPSGKSVAVVGFGTLGVETAANNSRGISYLNADDAVEVCLYQTQPESGLNASLCSKLIPRTFFDGERCAPSKLYEDLDLFYRVMLRAERVAVVDGSRYFYRQREGSTIQTFNRRRFDVIGVCERMIAYPAIAGSPKLRRAAEDRLFSASFNIFLLMHKHRCVDADMERKCWVYIRKYRGSTLRNSRTRARSKLGALLSYGGRRFAAMWTAFVH